MIPTHLPWLWPIDGEAVEGFEWQTDVLTSDAGNEQRIALRSLPRRALEYRYLLTGQDQRTAENTLHGNIGGVWGVPVWFDSTALPAALSAGETVLTLPAEHRDYAAGGTLVITTGPYAHEVVGIDAVTATTVTLSTPTVQDWPAGARVMPLRFGRIVDASASGARFTGDALQQVLQFALIGPQPWPAADESSGNYRSYPVWDAALDWRSNPGTGIERPFDELDTRLSDPLRDLRGGPLSTASISTTLNGRAAIGQHRRWLHARRGRQRAFWLPAPAQDLQLAANVAHGAATLDVQHASYAARVEQDPSRRDLDIRLRNGTRIRRRVTGSTVISPTVERLNLDSAIATGFSATAVDRIAWLTLTRLAADVQSLQWWGPDIATTTISVRGFRHDV